MSKNTMSTREFIMANYGISTSVDINKTVNEIQNTVTQFLKFDPQRSSFTIQNNSVNNIYVLPDRNVSATRGILLPALTGIFILDWKTDFNLVTAEWFAIATAANSEVTIVENYIN